MPTDRSELPHWPYRAMLATAGVALATARWTLFFGLSFAVTSGVFLLAHV
jgi:hypothetical protein